jgi:1-acyl-sn-glycerol-3-phosphate acyltransferase
MDKTIYYENEIEDDFANNNVKEEKLNPKFKYTYKTLFWKTLEFLIYRLVVPIAFIAVKIIHHHSYRNRKVLNKTHGGVYYYINHTNQILDAFNPSGINPFKHNYIIIKSDPFSIHGLSHFLRLMGAIPLGSNITQTKEMIKLVQSKIRKGKTITFYPEAHIWPYYTKVRPFKDNSFRFPAIDFRPVYAITNCYQKRVFSKRPKVITFIDGPFFADPKLSEKDNMKKLRDECYNVMVNRANKYSTYEYIKYVKVNNRAEVSMKNKNKI